MTCYIGGPYPFVGAICAGCLAPKLHMMPAREGWAACFGCGRQIEVGPAGEADIDAGARKTLAILRAPLPVGWQPGAWTR